MTNLLIVLVLLLVVLWWLHKVAKLNHSNIVYVIVELLCVATFVFILNKFVTWLLLLIFLTIFVMLAFGIKNETLSKISVKIWLVNFVVLLLKYYKVFDAYTYVDNLLKF